MACGATVTGVRAAVAAAFSRACAPRRPSPAGCRRARRDELAPLRGLRTGTLVDEGVARLGDLRGVVDHRRRDARACGVATTTCLAGAVVAFSAPPSSAVDANTITPIPAAA